MTLTLALIQNQFSSDPNQNMIMSTLQIKEAKSRGADLVILSELSTLPYFCQSHRIDHFSLAETMDGSSVKTFSKIAEKFQIHLVASIFEKSQTGLYYNTAVLFNDKGNLIGKYRKMHIPDDPGFHEKYYFTPGDMGYPVFETCLGKIGLLICWDQWFPEAARLLSLNGAELIIIPTAIGWDPNDTTNLQTKQLQAWLTIQKAHAIANGIPLAVCNRVGFEPHPNGQSGIQFWGHSFVCDSFGESIAQASTTKPAVLLASLDLKKEQAIRHIWPFLRDRRVDSYNQITKSMV